MKKICLISIITILIAWGCCFLPYQLHFRFLSGPYLLILPLLAGVLMVLIQNENKSYDFLPKLAIGSLLTGINTFIIILLIIFIGCHKPHNEMFCSIPNFIDILPAPLLIAGVTFFGGLIGIVIKGTAILLKTKPESKFILFLKKIFGGFFMFIGGITILAIFSIFLILLFNPASYLIKYIMVDFKLIDLIGVLFYYLLLFSTLFTILIPLIFIIIMGLMLFFYKNKFFNRNFFLILVACFLFSTIGFLLLSSYTEERFEMKKIEMKQNKVEKKLNITDFNSIYISRFVKFDDIKITQGNEFNITIYGTQYDEIGLKFEKVNNETLAIKRSELEAYYNTDTWTMENDKAPFSAGTKHLSIEITMPDIKKIEIEGGHVELVNFEVDNLEIKLNKRFNNIKGDIRVKETLKLDARGGIISLTGSAKNLIINSGDCWVEMDQFMVENATINAVNTSILNVNASRNMEILSGEKSGIVNYHNK